MHAVYNKGTSDMYKVDANCNELTEKTAAAIDSSTLLLLFVSTQQNNLGLCMKYAIKEWVSTTCMLFSVKLNVDITRVLVKHIIAAAASNSSAVLSPRAQEDICEWFPHFVVIESLFKPS
jgi:hypothetical protein